MHTRLFLLVAVLVVAGCGVNQPTVNPAATLPNIDEIFEKQSKSLEDSLVLETELRDLFNQALPASTAPYVYPMQQYRELRTKKVFGQYIAPDSGDRFTGYHTGDDVEVTDVATAVPFFVLVDATMVRKEIVPGYGGVVILEFIDGNQTYHALYGHVDLATVIGVVDDAVAGGSLLGYLGDDASVATDGERKHLHFGIYAYTGTELFAGYTATDHDLDWWVNPSDFFREREASEPAVVIIDATP